MNGRKRLLTLGAAAVCSIAARPSFAVDCSTLPNPVVLTGSTAFQAGALSLAKGLLSATAPMTLIYENAPGQGSLDGATRIMTNADLVSTGAKYTDTTGAALTCDFTTAMKADVGVSDAYWDTFTVLGARPGTIADVPGPVQAMLFIVPKGDTTWGGAISAEQAQDVWGCGMAANINMLTNTGIYQRGASSGTQAIISKAINVDLAAFLGALPTGTGGSSDNMRNNVSAGMAGKTIGFLAADNYDKNRNAATGSVDALAFRSFHQNKAYYADSSATAFDKKNVRNGHYTVWSPEHFFVKVDATGAVTDAKAKAFIDAVNASTTDAISALSTARVIPQCAMTVTKPTDGGLLSPYKPADPCGCFFESIATGVAAPPGCTACTDNTPCTALGKTCHHNFCE
jgi:hypothetical protein